MTLLLFFRFDLRSQQGGGVHAAVMTRPLFLFFFFKPQDVSKHLFFLSSSFYRVSDFFKYFILKKDLRKRQGKLVMNSFVSNGHFFPLSAIVVGVVCEPK